jgi:hypothetical protein
MTLSIEQIDRLLADWRNKLYCASQNMLDLQSLPTYQRLAGESGFPKLQLRGVTETQVTPAIEVMNELFQYFFLLSETVNKATELRKQVPYFFGSEAKIREIEEILTGASIQLSAKQVPLAQRELLSVAETTKAISPQQLLAAMTSAFQIARDAVLAVDAAWLRLEPNLADSNAESISLQKLADSLGQGDLKELAAVRQKIAFLSNLIDSDPLGVSADFDREIQPLIWGVKTKLGDLVKLQNQIRENFAIAHSLLKRLIELHSQAETTFAESREKIVDHSMLQTPLSIDRINALSQWLDRLETKFAEGLLIPVRVGLEN